MGLDARQDRARPGQRHFLDQVGQQHRAATTLATRLQDDGKARHFRLHLLRKGHVVELGIVALHHVQARFAKIAEIADLQLAERLQRAKRNDARLQAAKECQQQLVAVAALEHRAIQRPQAQRQQRGAKALGFLVQFAVGQPALRAHQREPVRVGLERRAKCADQGFLRQHAFGNIAPQPVFVGVPDARQ